jgi:hypothetical protein
MSSFDSSIPRSPIYQWRIPFETFPIPLISATRPNKWTVVISLRDFAIGYDPDVSCLLSSGFAKRRIPMCRWPFPFRDFSRVHGFAPCVPLRWTVLIQPRDIATCDAPLTQFLCQLETPDAETPTVSTMSATCPVKWTAETLSLFRVSRFREFRSPVATVFQNREVQNVDLTTLGSAATCPLRWTTHRPSRDFAISRIRSFGVQSFARPTPDYRFCDVIRSTVHDLS